VPTPSEAVSYVNETFDDISKVDGLMFTPPGGWTNLAIAGIRTYQTALQSLKGGRTFCGLLGTGYLSTDTVNDIWLILPPISTADTTRKLSLETGCTYSNSSTKLMLMYSSSYSGGSSSINLAEWDELRPLSTPVTAFGPVDMGNSGSISLKGLGGERKVVYVAVRYYAKVSMDAIAAGNASRANYYIDNVVYR
jgi:hypothetical protein